MNEDVRYVKVFGRKEMGTIYVGPLPRDEARELVARIWHESGVMHSVTVTSKELEVEPHEVLTLEEFENRYFE